MFILLEGIDGAGKGQQRLEVTKTLEARFKNLKSVDFPNHSSPIYEHLIHPALHEEIVLNSSSWFLSFVLDQMLMADDLLPTIRSKTDYYVVDGYFTTTLAYQCIMNKVMPIDTALAFAKDFKIPKPDIAIFIDVDPEIARRRKQKEEGHEEGMDIFERSMEKQKKIRAAFLKMAKENIFCEWEVVDGTGSIQEVHDQIIAILTKKKLI
jgi:dTMP kinase